MVLLPEPLNPVNQSTIPGPASEAPLSLMPITKPWFLSSG